MMIFFERLRAAMGYSRVTKYARSARFAPKKKATCFEAADIRCSLIDEAILMALAAFPFSSVREVS
jgi:hypothetical protein